MYYSRQVDNMFYCTFYSEWFFEIHIQLSFQLRLDFTTFVITGPSTNTLSTAKQFGGSQMMGDAAGVLASPATNCLTDTFSVTGSPGGNPPTICGTNTGYHSKYLEPKSISFL